MAKKKAVPKSGPKPVPTRTSLKPLGERQRDAVDAEDHVHDARQQQLVLNTFQAVFGDVLSSETFNSTLQEVKKALFDRDFDKAFSSEGYLDVYAARWSPTRALCYTTILQSIQAHLETIYQPGNSVTPPGELGPPPPRRFFKAVGIGGGAAEVVAFGAFTAQSAALLSEITLIDSAPWTSATRRLHAGLTTPPPLSKYASASARAANRALVAPSDLTMLSKQHNILTLPAAALPPLLGPAPLLVTLFFTLNELFTAAGIGPTTAFLLRLTEAVPRGSLLLVVDSPGSYSEAEVGREGHGRRYPMQWLVDKILLEGAGGQEEGEGDGGEGGGWEKLEGRDSVWFRLPEGLEYPIPLENMRYQMHLYCAKRRLETDGD